MITNSLEQNYQLKEPSDPKIGTSQLFECKLKVRVKYNDKREVSELVGCSCLDALPTTTYLKFANHLWLKKFNLQQKLVSHALAGARHRNLQMMQ